MLHCQTRQSHVSDPSAKLYRQSCFAGVNWPCARFLSAGRLTFCSLWPAGEMLVGPKRVLFMDEVGSCETCPLCLLRLSLLGTQLCAVIWLHLLLLVPASSHSS